MRGENGRKFRNGAVKGLANLSMTKDNFMLANLVSSTVSISDKITIDTSRLPFSMWCAYV